MSPSSDWNTLHAPISFLPHCLVHFWGAYASPTASRPLDLPQHPVVARSFYQSVYHAVGLSSVSSLITTVKHQTCPLLRTPHRVKSSSFLWFSLLHITSPICKSATSPRPLPTTLGVAHRLLVYGQPMFIWRFAFIPWSFWGCSFVSLLLTLNVKSAGRLPDHLSTAAPLSFSALWSIATLRIAPISAENLSSLSVYWFLPCVLLPEGKFHEHTDLVCFASLHNHNAKKNVSINKQLSKWLPCRTTGFLMTDFILAISVYMILSLEYQMLDSH